MRGIGDERRAGEQRVEAVGHRGDRVGQRRSSGGPPGGRGGTVKSPSAKRSASACNRRTGRADERASHHPTMATRPMSTTAMAARASQNRWMRALTSLVSSVSRSAPCTFRRTRQGRRRRGCPLPVCRRTGCRSRSAAQRLGDLGSGREVALDRGRRCRSSRCRRGRRRPPGRRFVRRRRSRRGVERQVVLEGVLVEGGDDVRVVLEVGGDSLPLALGEEHGRAGTSRSTRVSA